MAIRYYIDCEGFHFNQRRLISAWLKAVALSLGYRVGDVNVIFTSSEKLLEVNRQFLQHDYLTDIITFDESDLDEGFISGELYIDTQTVNDNAALFSRPAIEELHRVVVHGVIHLCGQGDKSEVEATEMREKEQAALALLAKMSKI
ncbi:MAG: rRNA maturation RNase YbeY [Rikenellaceae bacterium]